MSLVNIKSQLDPLEEVWLGDCYPIEFFTDIDFKTKTILDKLILDTKESLLKIEQSLKNIGIKVHRPVFTTNSNDYRDPKTENLYKPPVAIRDNNLVLDNTLFCLRNDYKINPFCDVINNYKSSGASVIEAQFLEKYGYIEPPSIVRLGKDLLIDIDSHEHSWSLFDRDVLPEWEEKYRISLFKTGGHSDSVFCPIRAGLLITSHWKNNYNRELPGWDVYHIPEQKKNKKYNNYSGNAWWIKDENNLITTQFNDFVIDRALNWIGNPQETVFEVNSLVINENLVMTTGIPDKETMNWYSKHNIDIIPAEFSTRDFWDAGVHCLTVDIRRTGDTLKDYFPERTNTRYYYE